jgi:hypothetical protein
MKGRSSLLAILLLALVAAVVGPRFRNDAVELPPPSPVDDPAGARVEPVAISSPGTVSPEPSEDALAGQDRREPVPEPNAETDTEWRNLPRTTKDLVSRTVHLPQCADARYLFRNACFNPRDVHVAPGFRAEIERAIEAAKPGVEASLRELQATQEREFDVLHARGRTVEVDLLTLEGQARLQKLGAERVFAVRDGQTFGASKAELPETAKGERLLRDAGVALCIRIAAAGALTADELEGLAVRVRSEPAR